MVRRDLESRGISDKRVLAAMDSVPRECFVPADVQHLAYADQPLPIGHEQTISQPYIVALMTELANLNRHSRVLEVGYHTAVLAGIAEHVWSIERIEELSVRAERRLTHMGIRNVTLLVGDGACGHSEGSPFDAIVVAAAAPEPPQLLLDQLALDGRLVIPIGDRAVQVLYGVERTVEGFKNHTSGSCRFVPLVSPHAFTR